MAKPVYTLDQIVGRIAGDSWWTTGTVTFAMPDASPSAGSEAAGFKVMTDHMKDMAALAFVQWDDLVDIGLSQVASGADISFSYSSTTGGSTYSSSTYGAMVDGRWAFTGSEVWIDSTWESQDEDADIAFGEYGFMTYMHEIGHSLGLDHPGDYNGDGSYAADALYAQDTHRYTIMSYFDANADGSNVDHYGKDGLWKYASTPMLHDIAAIQSIYGADLTTRTGNTVYGFGSNAGREAYDFSKNTDPIVTIWDAGGKDTLNLSGFSTNQRIDLHQGAFSNVGYMTKNVAIAFGATIENAFGGTGTDVVIGNVAANRLYGLAGADKLYGQGGNDFLYGGKGNDRLDGQGGASDAAVYGKAEASYKVVDKGAYVVVTDLTGTDGTDTLWNVERIVFQDGIVLL